MWIWIAFCFYFYLFYFPLPFELNFLCFCFWFSSNQISGLYFFFRRFSLFLIKFKSSLRIFNLILFYYQITESTHKHTHISIKQMYFSLFDYQSLAPFGILYLWIITISYIEMGVHYFDSHLKFRHSNWLYIDNDLVGFERRVIMMVFISDYRNWNGNDMDITWIRIEVMVFEGFKHKMIKFLSLHSFSV